MLPLLDQNQQHSDEAGELAPDVVDAFHRDGMFLMWVPRALGGSELGPLDSLEVLEITSYGDPSAGWVQMAACLSTGVAAAYLGPHAVDELFHDGRYPVIAGQGHAAGHRAHRRRRVPPFRGVELRIRAQARHLHPLARDHRRDRRAAHLRDSRRAGDAPSGLMGCARPPRHRQHRLHDDRRLRARGVLPLRVHSRREPRRHLPPRHHRVRDGLPLGLGDGCRSPLARRAQGSGRREEGPCRQHRRVRPLPDAVRRARSRLPRGARVRVGGLARRRADLQCG